MTIQMRPRNVKDNRQRFHYTYHLGFADIKVCRKTFMDTLDLKPGYIKCLNHRRDPLTGLVRPSKQGKSKINYNKISFI